MLLKILLGAIIALATLIILGLTYSSTNPGLKQSEEQQTQSQLFRQSETGMYHDPYRLRPILVWARKTDRLREVLSELQGFRASSEYREGILQAYRSFREDLNEAFGVVTPRGFTEREAVKHLISEVPQLAPVALTVSNLHELYSRARFSDHVLSERDMDACAEWLRELYKLLPITPSKKGGGG